MKVKSILMGAVAACAMAPAAFAERGADGHLIRAHVKVRWLQPEDS